MRRHGKICIDVIYSRFHISQGFTRLVELEQVEIEVEGGRGSLEGDPTCLHLNDVVCCRETERDVMGDKDLQFTVGAESAPAKSTKRGHLQSCGFAAEDLSSSECICAEQFQDLLLKGRRQGAVSRGES